MKNTEKNLCDLILSSEYILPMDEESSVVKDGAIVVKDGKIEAIGAKNEIEELYQAKETMNCGRAIIMPGLVNCHTHAAMGYFRGLADDLPLDRWLNEHIWPAEKRLVDADFVRRASELSCLEMLLSGTTCFADMYFFAAETMGAALAAGMRVQAGECAIDFPTPSCRTPEDAFRLTGELRERFKGDPLASFAINLHSPYACGRETIMAALRLKGESGLPVRMHVSETRQEYDEAKSKWGLSPVKRLEALGLLLPDLLAIHCAWPDDDDIASLKENGVKIAHCPKSNLKLGSGIAPIAKMLSQGLTVGLGTDGAASNNRQDIFSEMNACALVHKGISLDPSLLPARDAAGMATREAASALGLAGQAGSLEPGKSADLIAIDLDRPHLTPLYDPYSHIVYAAVASDVRDVMVAGRWLVRNREPLTLDRERITAEAREFYRKYTKNADFDIGY